MCVGETGVGGAKGRAVCVSEGDRGREGEVKSKEVCVCVCEREREIV